LFSSFFHLYRWCTVIWGIRLRKSSLRYWKKDLADHYWRKLKVSSAGNLNPLPGYFPKSTLTPAFQRVLPHLLIALTVLINKNYASIRECGFFDLILVI
jgi:hypothetical protein